MDLSTRPLLEHIDDHLRRTHGAANRGRPRATLAFAQSLDGSITLRPDCRLPLSNPRSLTLTHHLRARHDAILVGVNTVLVDDPRLTVRLVPGASPWPVVVDSRLRTPTGASLLRGASRAPLIVTTADAPEEKAALLRAAGATILRIASNPEGTVDLVALLGHLHRLGVSTLMVEGGARIITSFLSARLVDLAVLTVCPLFVGGPRAYAPAAVGAMPRLRNVRAARLDDDLILVGDLRDTGPGT